MRFLRDFHIFIATTQSTPKLTLSSAALRSSGLSRKHRAVAPKCSPRLSSVSVHFRILIHSSRFRPFPLSSGWSGRRGRVGRCRTGSWPIPSERWSARRMAKERQMNRRGCSRRMDEYEFCKGGRRSWVARLLWRPQSAGEPPQGQTHSSRRVCRPNDRPTPRRRPTVTPPPPRYPLPLSRSPRCDTQRGQNAIVMQRSVQVSVGAWQNLQG